MAIEIGNIPALDQNPVVGIGLAIPFQSTATSGSDSIFRINYTTAEQVKYNMINYFLTNKGERVFNPNFGGDISRYVFEPNDPATTEILKKGIEDDIKLIFPMVKLKEVIVTSDPEYHNITVQIFYSVFSSLDEFIEFNIPL
jgi:phage baseplate assembly protein W